MNLHALPGAERFERGLRDIAAGATTADALFVALVAERLRAVGALVPTPVPKNPELALYQLLVLSHGDDAHGRYLALVRLASSFARAAEVRAAQSPKTTLATPK